MNSTKIGFTLPISLVFIVVLTYPASAASRVSLPLELKASALCAICLRDQAATGNESTQTLLQRTNEFVSVPRTAQSSTGRSFAFAPIGRISTKGVVTIATPSGTKQSGYSNASAFMVSPCHILTNRHVVFGDAPASFNGFSTTFSVGNDGTGKPTHVVEAAPVVIPNDDQVGNDWTLLMLKSCISDEKIGWMKMGDMEAHQIVMSGGFPNDQNGLTSSKKCEIHTAMFNFTFSHDCATREGDSGSPLFKIDADGTPIAVGLSTAENRATLRVLQNLDEDHANEATGLNQLVANPKIQQELQRGFDWYATKHPGHENPQVAMARRYRKERR